MSKKGREDCRRETGPAPDAAGRDMDRENTGPPGAAHSIFLAAAVLSPKDGKDTGRSSASMLLGRVAGSAAGRAAGSAAGAGGAGGAVVAPHCRPAPAAPTAPASAEKSSRASAPPVCCCQDADDEDADDAAVVGTSTSTGTTRCCWDDAAGAEDEDAGERAVGATRRAEFIKALNMLSGKLANICDDASVGGSVTNARPDPCGFMTWPGCGQLESTDASAE